MMKRFLSNMSFKLRLFLPILVGVIVIAFVVAFLSVQITEQNINKSIKRTLRQEVDILTKMFERERALKLEKVKSDLKVARSFFEAKDFYVSDQQITMK